MAPRNDDADTSYKKKNSLPVEGNDDKDFVPCLLHKKHKVVKLVKNQMQKIQEEGLICVTSGLETEENEVILEHLGRRRLRAASEETPVKGASFYWFLLIFLVTIFLLIFLMVWISAGPLSNSIAHTPIPLGSFVTTDACSLEKKYLLRWSKPEYFE